MAFINADRIISNICVAAKKKKKKAKKENKRKSSVCQGEANKFVKGENSLSSLWVGVTNKSESLEWEKNVASCIKT